MNNVKTADTSLENLTDSDIKIGSHLFKLQCARCHGIEGRGGNGPSLRRATFTYVENDADLISIIQNGIPGTEMPGTWLLALPDIRMVAGYILSLGQSGLGDITGNADNGKLIYDTKGACRTCHMINGEGGSLGPDLSRVGAKRSVDFITESLENPGFFKKESELTNTTNGFIQNLMYRVTTKEGKKVTGMRVNEDAFTLQLRDAQNSFHSFKKKDLIEIEKLFEKSLMPGIKDVLTKPEINDLIAYLVSLK